MIRSLLAACLVVFPAAAQDLDLERVCVSWGGPDDGTSAVIYRADGTAEEHAVSWMDAPERGAEIWRGTVPAGAFARLSEALPGRLAAMGPEPAAESCGRKGWLWVVEARLADGAVMRMEGACPDGPSELLYRDIVDWTDLLNVLHDGSDGEARMPATMAMHDICRDAE